MLGVIDEGFQRHVMLETQHKIVVIDFDSHDVVLIVHILVVIKIVNNL